MIYGVFEFIPSWIKQFNARTKLFNATHDLYNSDSYKSALKGLFNEKTFTLKQQEYLLGLLIDFDFPITNENKKNIVNEILKQNLFKIKILAKEFLIEFIMLILFGLIPVIGILKVYFQY